MRRSVIGVLVFLLLGAITTILVAWGCVIYGTTNLRQAVWGQATDGQTRWSFVQLACEGLSVVQLAEGHVYDPSLMASSRMTESEIPEWVQLRPHTDNDAEIGSTQVAAGWPWLAWTCESVAYESPQWSGLYPESWLNGVVVFPFGSHDPRPLPYRPLWRNFVASTGLYAILTCMCWIVMMFLWRASRRIATPLLPSRSNPICPRCGYDQRGTIAQWIDRCPIEGTCSECGLLFDWSELLNPTVRLPHWNIEKRMAAWRFPLQVLATSLRAFWPWPIWRQVRMSHEHQSVRTVLFLATHLLLMWTMFALAHGLIAWKLWDGSVTNGYVPSTGPWPVFLQALFIPWSTDSIGTLTGPAAGGLNVANIYPYNAPHSHWLRVWGETSFWFPLWLLAAHACCGLAFMALPVSRRKAKVRARHIVRMTAYGFPPLFILLYALIAMITLHELGLPGWRVAFWFSVALSFGLIPWAVSWWSVGTAKYLRMPHGWAVGLTIVAIGIMLPMVPWAILSLIVSPL